MEVQLFAAARSALAFGGSQIESRVVKLAAAIKWGGHDAAGDARSVDVPKFARPFLELFLDLLLVAFVHPAALQRRSRQLVVVICTVFEDDDLLSVVRSFRAAR